MIGIVDYGMGNLLSVKNSLDYLGENCKICKKPEEIEKVDKIILPGVGAFPDCIRNIHKLGFFDVLNHEVMVIKKPILGICLGMQVMAEVGYEMERTKGFGWFDAEVLPIPSKGSKIPNIGWENVEFKTNSVLFRNFSLKPDFYFVHSFYMKCKHENDIDSWYYFDDTKITASIHRGNIFGTQFHPEKSSDFGRQILINFLDY